MKKQTTFRKTIEKVWKNRAAIVIAIAATVFMCGLTALEFVALRMEWNLPVLAYVTGDSDSYIIEQDRSEEMKLDESTENVMLEEDMLQGESQSENSGKDITQGESQSEDDIVPGEGKNENVRQEDTVQGENQQEKDSQQSASDEAEFPYYIKVNRRQNCITVYTSDENGEYTIPVKHMICSSGYRHSKLPNGVYPLKTKYEWKLMADGTWAKYATRITGPFLFHSVPYESKDSNDVFWYKYRQLGDNQSSGCIRLLCKDAKWIQDNCPEGTPVRIILGEEMPELKQELMDAIPELVKGYGWDPTDPDPENPIYFAEPDATPEPTRVPWITPKPDQFTRAPEVD